MTDELYLKRALLLAGRSAEPVGCGVVIVSNGAIVAESFNSQRADNIAVYHAEIKAVIMANKRLESRSIPNATVYCSCEPCAMCLTALWYAKIDRIVFAQSMKQLFPGDRQADFDAQAYISCLNFTPQLVHIPVR